MLIKLVNIIGIVVFVVILIVFFGLIDHYRFRNDKDPLFILKTNILKDGGNEVHCGMGYQIIRSHMLGYDGENKKSFYYSHKEFNIFPNYRDVKNNYPAKEEKEKFQIIY
ncbi:MAG: hypothetical protein ABIH87_02160 [bacterium]